MIPDWLRFTPLSTLDGVSIDVVDRHDPDLSLRLTVRGEDTTLVVALEDLPATLRVRGPAKLWSPDDPHLYDVDAELVDEDGRVLDAFST